MKNAKISNAVVRPGRRVLVALAAVAVVLFVMPSPAVGRGFHGAGRFGAGSRTMHVTPSFRGFAPARGFTPNRGFVPARGVMRTSAVPMRPATNVPVRNAVHLKPVTVRATPGIKVPGGSGGMVTTRTRSFNF